MSREIEREIISDMRDSGLGKRAREKSQTTFVRGQHTPPRTTEQVHQWKQLTGDQGFHGSDGLSSPALMLGPVSPAVSPA